MERVTPATISTDALTAACAAARDADFAMFFAVIAHASVDRAAADRSDLDAQSCIRAAAHDYRAAARGYQRAAHLYSTAGRERNTAFGNLAKPPVDGRRRRELAGLDLPRSSYLDRLRRVASARRRQLEVIAAPLLFGREHPFTKVRWFRGQLATGAHDVRGLLAIAHAGTMTPTTSDSALAGRRKDMHQ